METRIEHLFNKIVAKRQEQRQRQEQRKKTQIKKCKDCEVEFGKMHPNKIKLYCVNICEEKKIK